MRKMNLELDDYDFARLEYLAEKAGSSKVAVLRKFLRGGRATDRTERQTLARLSQLGALLRHCAEVLKDRGEGIGDFIAIGTEIREIALKLSRGENDENADSDLQED